MLGYEVTPNYYFELEFNLDFKKTKKLQCVALMLFLFCRTDALLLKLSLLVGQQVFYDALWGSMLVSPLVRLPASVFIVTHFDRMVSLRQQTHMLGHDHRLVVSFAVFLV